MQYKLHSDLFDNLTGGQKFDSLFTRRHFVQSSCCLDKSPKDFVTSCFRFDFNEMNFLNIRQPRKFDTTLATCIVTPDTNDKARTT